jgi:hypothetical protein
MDNNDTEPIEGVRCGGRTMTNRYSKPVVTRLERREDGSLFIRVDDPENLAAYIEVTISGDALRKLDNNE